jgi:hypothetical protein
MVVVALWVMEMMRVAMGIVVVKWGIKMLIMWVVVVRMMVVLFVERNRKRQP